MDLKKGEIGASAGTLGIPPGEIWGKESFRHVSLERGETDLEKSARVKKNTLIKLVKSENLLICREDETHVYLASGVLTHTTCFGKIVLVDVEAT